MFSPINRAIIDAMRNYGVIVADLADGGFWLNGVNDERWDHDELMKLRTVPVSAFEVLDTIKPPVRFTGPARVGRGPRTFQTPASCRRRIPTSAPACISTSHRMGGKPGRDRPESEAFGCDDKHRGPFTLTFTPPAPGTYILRIEYGGKEWIEPPNITFTAAAAPAHRHAPARPPARTVAVSHAGLRRSRPAG